MIGIVFATVFVSLLLKTGLKSFAEKYGRLLVCIAAVGMLAFCFLWMINTRFIYAGDMEKIWQYAGMMLKGDYSGWEKGGYPYEWSQNNALILLVSVLLKTFGLNGSFAAFYSINIFFLGVAFFSICGLCKKLTDDNKIRTIQMLGVILYLPYAFLFTTL
ncbi:MAG: hypothetical protein J6Y12_03270, partial [Lachnospiraceae bacterium]|nr:hypothetical protein [Lachnospiraceae bacterium]